MENDIETLEKTMPATDVADASPASSPTDLATLFADWIGNPLVAIAISDPRLCRFIGDLLDGNSADCAVRRNFPQQSHKMPEDLPTRFDMDENTASQVAEMGHKVMAGDWSDEAVNILLRAARHDDDVKNADNAGYIRGRNSAIEIRRRNSIPTI